MRERCGVPARRWLTWSGALGLAAILGGALPPVGVRGAAAAPTARITNISAGVAGGVASFELCVMAPRAPAAGGVTVHGPRGDQQAALQYAGQSCGPGSYLMQATFGRLPGGQYRFKVACVLLSPDAHGSQEPLVPCLVRDVGFVSNFQGSTVGNGCQVDFDPSRDMAPQECSASGAMGSIPGAAPPGAAARPAPAATPASRPQPAVAWDAPAVGRAFFAEGYTGAGYHEYLSLLNPHRTPLAAQITVYRADGATRTAQVAVAGLSRRTIDINALAPRASTALRVTASGSFVAERALYVPTGSGHIVGGAALPAQRWYVAEGYNGQGYDEALRIFNPYDAAAAITITSYTSRGAARAYHTAVQGGTRLNLPLAAVAPDGPSSLIVESGAPVVVESIVQIGANLGPSAAMALTAASRTWYFPDGSTLAGNQEFLSLFNPGATPALVRIGPLSTVDAPPPIVLRVAPHARASVPLHDMLRRAGMAAAVQADRPVVAQEVRYTDRGGVSLVDGVTQPARSWGLAEGYAGAGFREWLALCNPGAQRAQVTVRLIGRNGPARTLRVQAPPRRLLYLYVNDLIVNGPVAALIDADRPIVAGRTLVFNNNSGLSTTSAVALSGG